MSGCLEVGLRPGAGGLQQFSVVAMMVGCESRFLTVSIDIDGLGPTLFCHATPRRDDEFILVDSPIQRWEQVLHGIAEQVVICGHTHMPFDRLVN